MPNVREEVEPVLSHEEKDNSREPCLRANFAQTPPLHSCWARVRFFFLVRFTKHCMLMSSSRQTFQLLNHEGGTCIGWDIYIPR
jgi:hypothetical protein